jgi:CheY-like chemotaxis protein
MKDTLSYKILVAIGSEQDLERLQEIVTKLGKRYTLLFAKNSDEVYAKADAEHPDLIIVDWLTQNINGLQIIRQLKKQRNTRAIPVIMSAGNSTDSTDLKDALLAGAIDYIRKPFDQDETSARIKSALRLFDLQKKILQQNQQIRVQSKAHVRVKNRIFKAFLVYAVVAFFVSVVSFWLFREMEENQKVTTLVDDIYTAVLVASEHDQEHFNKSTFFKNYFDSDQAHVYMTHSETFDGINDMIEKLKNMPHIDKFYINDDLDDLQEMTSNYNILFGESLLGFSSNPNTSERNFADLYKNICASGESIQKQIKLISEKVRIKENQIIRRFQLLNVTIVTFSVILTLLLTISIRFVFNSDQDVEKEKEEMI